MIEIVIPYRNRSIGSMDVRRVLPFPKRRAVGPFVFVDDFGPVEILRGLSLDVLPHPHIGLATVSYLFSGNMTHRDSLGTVQIIKTGEVNWMTAGRGIVHSERVSDAPNVSGETLLGMQTWIALPENVEDCEPDFSHHDETDLPVMEAEGVRAKIILGEIFGKKSPVKTFSSPVYAECFLENKAQIKIPAEVEERSIYILKGAVFAGNERFEAGNMVVFETGKEVVISADGETHFMIIGGARLEKPRVTWWNFVSTSQERIEQAKQDWRNQKFKKIPDDDKEFVPLPDWNEPQPKPQPL